MDGDCIEGYQCLKYDLNSGQSGSCDDEVVGKAFKVVSSFIGNDFLDAGQYKGCASQCIDLSTLAVFDLYALISMGCQFLLFV